MNTLLNTLGIELPIIQAPMAGVQDARLASAVAEAGGLGSIPAAMLSADRLLETLKSWKADTDKPVNVNFFCHKPANADETSLAAWRNSLHPYYQELGVTADPPGGGGRAPFSAAQLEALAACPPAVVSFHFGLPEESLLQQLFDLGVKIISTATTVAEAQWLSARNVHGIIAQGIEAGGHRGLFLNHDLNGQLGTMALVPQIVAAVDTPVIAAGGIADASGVAAAQALGAQAVQVGTSYLRSPEATTSNIHRQALADPDYSTALTNVLTGRPARGLVNRAIAELGPISALAPVFPHAANALAPLRKAAEANGSGDFSPLWSGQNRQGCVERPAAEITRALAAGWRQ